MDFITKQDFLTHMYESSIDAISDNDDEILNHAIATAMAEASGYLSRFNTDIIFVSEDKIKYANLRIYIKDMSKWHFINICNVNVDIEIAQKHYKAALAELDKIQSGRTVPKAWPLADEDLLEDFRPWYH